MFYLLSVLLFSCNLGGSARLRGFEENYDRVENYAIDYFSNSLDSAVYYVGNLRLMPSDSINFNQKNIYRYALRGDTLNIYFKERILFNYLIKDGYISTGKIFYPFEDRIALWGQFKNNKIDGIVVSFSQNGDILEIMEFHNGKYKGHIYQWQHGSISSRRLSLSSPFENSVIER